MFRQLPKGIAVAAAAVYFIVAHATLATGPAAAAVEPRTALPAPTFTPAAPVQGGFTATLQNRADFPAETTFRVTSDDTGVTGVVAGAGLTVTGVAPNRRATVTVTAEAATFTSSTATVTGTSSLGTLPALTFTTPLSTFSAFTSTLSNRASYPNGTTFTVTVDDTRLSAGMVGTVLAVTGLQAGTTAGATVTANHPDYTPTSVVVTGTAAIAVLPAPVFAPATPTAAGYTAILMNIGSYPAGTGFTVTTSAPAVAGAVTGGLLTVTGLSPNQSVTVTVAANAAAYVGSQSQVAGTAAKGVMPGLTVSALTSTATGFTGTVSSVSALPAGSTFSVSGATGTVIGGVLTVTGLTPNQTATVTVSADNPNYTSSTVRVTGNALKGNLPSPVFAAPTSTSSGFTSTLTNLSAYPAGTTFTATTATAGATATITGGVLTVSGLQPAATATATVTITNPNYFTVVAQVTSAASPSMFPSPVFAAPTSTSSGFTSTLTNLSAYPAGTTFTATTATAGATATITGGVLTVSGLQPAATATATVTITNPQFLPMQVAITGAAANQVSVFKKIVAKRVPLQGKPGVVLAGIVQGLAPGTELAVYFRPQGADSFVESKVRAFVTVKDGVLSFLWQGRASTAPITVYVSTVTSPKQESKRVTIPQARR